MTVTKPARWRDGGPPVPEHGYCASRTRAAVESGAWARLHDTCANPATRQDPDNGKWYCRIHIDKGRRYD